MGRKSKWESHVLPRLEEIKKWCNTMNEEQICEALGIVPSTFAEYKKKYPELVEALKKGRSDLVQRCKSNLIKRADGYEYEEKKVTQEYVNIPKGLREMLLDVGLDADVVFNTKLETVKIETTTKHERPDVAANNALLRVFDEDWHESTAEARKLKQEELDIKRQKAEADSW